MNQPKKGRRAFTLIEIMVAMSILGIVIASVGPTFRKSSISTQGAALTLAAALTEARQQAITQQIPVALVIPSGNGTQGQADSYYIASGEQPRITQVKWFGAEQPDLRLMVGHWPLDTTKLRTPALTTTITPPPETKFESDLDVSRWSLTQSKDFAFIFTPRGKLVTNGLPHFDGAYHILVSNGGQSSMASAPGTSGLPAATSPDLFTPSEVGSPYTVTIDPAGAVAVTPGVVGAFDGASYILDHALVSAAPEPATATVKPTANPVVTTVSVLPDPAKLNLPVGADMLLTPNRSMTITTRAQSPERVPLFCRWTVTAGGGGVSSAESVRMTYRPASGEWESTWHWKAPAGATAPTRFTIQGRVHDGQGHQTPAYLGAGTADPVIEVGDRSAQVLFHSYRDGDCNVYCINADGSGLKRLTDGQSDAFAYYSPDRARIIFRSARDGTHQLYATNADGSGETKLTNSAGGNMYPAWSPDGTRIVFESSRDGSTQVYAMNADGTGQTRLTNTPGYRSSSPSWSPDGTRIVFKSEPIVVPQFIILPGGIRVPAPPGPGENYEIYSMNADGSGTVKLTNALGDDKCPTWSPDRTHIVFVASRAGTGIYTMNVNGTGETRLTNNPAGTYSYEPEWSPDGTQIAYSSNLSGNFEIYIMNANGTAQTQLTNTPGRKSWPTWSADGTQLFFNSDNGGNSEIYSVKSDGTGLTNLSNDPGSDFGFRQQ